MSHWEDIRAQARTRHREVSEHTGGAVGAEALLAAADALSGLTRYPVPSGDALLAGGVAALNREDSMIWYAEDVEPWQMLFAQAHEYAHYWLGDHHGACRTADVTVDVADEESGTGTARVEGYGPHERREREANVFALEFLLPTDLLRRLYVELGWGTAAIVAQAGLPDWIVWQQLCRALLVLPAAAREPAPALNSLHALDTSQAEAAHAPRGPLLLEAGPGTGKTRTLVGRIMFLLEQGVDPASMLALTFSNKAAEEMRTRVAHAAPQAAPALWMGTFHSFGLELLRKYGTCLKLPAKPDVLDQIDALLILERMLPDLALVHYQNLYDPTMYLRAILGAISRAKDELVGPERYTALAQAMLMEAGTPEEVTRAEKALEVARAYTLYQQHLQAQGLLDFGDLIMRAVTLLREHDGVKTQVQAAYAHILVDEYQDVNRASGLLLREIAGAGTGLWVVGDARQAIYRFRGAAPANMRHFADDFPGARVLSLRRNYRSQPAVLTAVAALAPQMRATAGAPFTPWETHRPEDGGRLIMEVAENGGAEGRGVAATIERLRTTGIAYRDQAVLCRSHTGLARMAAALEAEGIPILYLGDLFEREEVRDLLALLSLACEGHGRGLARVACFPEYAIPFADVRSLWALAREADEPFPAALRLAQDAATISERGKRGLALLACHLEGITHGTTPWTMLASYLFDRSAYLRAGLIDSSTTAHQQRMVLYQFLQFAREWGRHKRVRGTEPKRAFLRFVRRMESYGEERTLRQAPEWAEGLDAVRLLTVHASKGLEFRAVYLPQLGQGTFPARGRPADCPPPRGMLAADPADDDAEEEECLFFVALSRARDVLCLSRAERPMTQRQQPSVFLGRIAVVLPGRPDGPITWCADDDGEAAEEEKKTPPRLARLPVKPAFDARDLALYNRCPRQYYYEFVLGLGGKRDEAAYVQMHRCVYRVLAWLQDERDAGGEATPVAAREHLGAVWTQSGPVDHPYAAMYLKEAEKMVERAVTRSRHPFGKVARRELGVTLAHGRVQLEPDNLEVAEENGQPSVLVQRLRTGRATKSEPDDDIYAVYQEAARHAYPDAQIKVEIVYLSGDETQEVALSPKKVKTRLAHYDAAIAGILEGRFPACPDDRRCLGCPHYFICPSGGDVPSC
jgi:superfamily I DNA/RNA helicase